MTLLVEHRDDGHHTVPDRGALVSVLSPVRDEHRYLPAMLDSVLAQDWPHFEVLLVDDGSTDDTVDIIRHYASSDQRIRLVASGTAMGKVAAFNTAFAAAAGSILCHIGGDDTVPANALSSRVTALLPYLDRRAVAFFKLELFESVPGDAPVVVPRGPRGSMSGPSITMTRPLADLVMPVPGHLVSEDIWMGHAADAAAEVRVDSTDVVVHYRRHSGNSNPRHKSFAQMTDAMRARYQPALRALLDTDRIRLSATKRREIEDELRGQEMRAQGSTLALLTSDLPPTEKLALATMSHPALWGVRRRFLTQLTGWRGR